MLDDDEETVGAVDDVAGAKSDVSVVVVVVLVTHEPYKIKRINFEKRF